MIDSATPSTPSPEENLLGLTDPHSINAAELEGFLQAEKLIYTDIGAAEAVSISRFLELHRVALGRLYEWAGRWRSHSVRIGAHIPPAYHSLSQHMGEFVFELNTRIVDIQDEDELAQELARMHHRLVWIHPFTNGNGRMARILTNWIAARFGYAPIALYSRNAGLIRQTYIQALRYADAHDLTSLTSLIREQLTPTNQYSDRPSPR
jgi:cell filamentation protein